MIELGTLRERAGRHDVSVLDGGPQEWADATGRAPATGMSTDMETST